MMLFGSVTDLRIRTLGIVVAINGIRQSCCVPLATAVVDGVDRREHSHGSSNPLRANTSANKTPCPLTKFAMLDRSVRDTPRLLRCNFSGRGGGPSVQPTVPAPRPIDDRGVNDRCHQDREGAETLAAGWRYNAMHTPAALEVDVLYLSPF